MRGAIIPHSEEAEQGVLSSMMQGGHPVMANVVQVIGETAADWFHIPANRNLYGGLVDWWHAGHVFDLNMFTRAMLDARRATDMGGPAHITSIYLFGTPANLEMYLNSLTEKRWLRYVCRTAETLLKTAKEHQNDVQSILRSAEGALADITTRATVTMQQRNIRQIVDDVIHDLSEPEKVLGLSTGFPKLDDLVGGLAVKAKIVLAGLISGGKSAFAECLADSLAVSRQIPTAIFTFEMSAAQTAQRIIQIRSEVPFRSVARKEVSMFETEAFTQAAGEVGSAPLHIIDDRLDIAGIRARCMQLKPRIVIIDYLQIVPERKQQGENRTDQLDRMSAETKQIAQQLGLTLIELSQLTEQASGKMTTRGSKGITADSDQLWIIEGDDDETKDVIPKQLTVAKQRDGARSQVAFSFARKITKFRERK